MADRVLFVADQLADAPRGGEVRHPGGAELTDAAALAACPWPVEALRFSQLEPSDLKRFDVIVVGNSETASEEQLTAIARTNRAVSFEHDVRICRWRGNFPAAKEPLHAFAHRCSCPHESYAELYARALGVIYLTARQRQVFEKNPFFESPPAAVLGSSLFEAGSLDRLESLSEQAGERKGALYLWSPQEIKGTRRATRYCQRHGLEAAPIVNVAPGDVYTLMSGSEVFVYLPIGLEPAGRMPVEARLVGCRVVVNQFVGVAGEPWWREDRAAALRHLRHVPARFWQRVGDFLSAPPRYVEPHRPRARAAAAKALDFASQTGGAVPFLARHVSPRLDYTESYPPW